MRAQFSTLLGLLSTSTALSIPQQQTLNEYAKKELCPLASKVKLPDDGLYSALRFVEDDSIRSRQVERLSKAVQVPTTVNDYMIDPYDEGFTPFVELHEILESLFPLTYVSKAIETCVGYTSRLLTNVHSATLEPVSTMLTDLASFILSMEQTSL